MIKKIINKIQSPLGIILALFYLVILLHSILFVGWSCADFDFSCLITGFLLIGTPFFMPLLYIVGSMTEKALLKISFFNNLILKFRNELSKKSFFINIFLIEFLLFHIVRFIYFGIKYVNNCGYASMNDHYCNFVLPFDIQKAISLNPNSWLTDIINISYVPIIIFFVSIFLLLFSNYNKIKYSLLILNSIGIILIFQVLTLPTENFFQTLNFYINKDKTHDEQLVDVMSNARYAVEKYFVFNGELPESKEKIFSELTEDNQKILTNSKVNFDYIRVDELSYEICGEFKTSSEKIERIYQYTKGKNCYENEITFENIFSTGMENDLTNSFEYNSFVISNYIANKLEKFYLKNDTYEGFVESKDSQKIIDKFIESYLFKGEKPEYRIYANSEDYIIKLRYEPIYLKNSVLFGTDKIYCLDKNGFQKKETISKQDIDSFGSATNCID